ncbi:MAG TPA: thioredoxin family protein [Nitrososphaerales archaeon]|nr:thioredoxin family protein [Nitrososphaerales archaeon]
MIPSALGLGAPAPDFDLPGVDSRHYSLASFSNRPVLVVIFSCNHCPYVKDYEIRMVSIQRDYAAKGVQLVAINSNDDKAYPEDSFPQMVKRAKERGFNFPYLRDESQEVVEAYGGVCTPHVFAFDGKRILRYRGRIDDSRDQSKVTSPDLRNALDDMVAGKSVRVPDTKPFGCSIKWYSLKPA